MNLGIIFVLANILFWSLIILLERSVFKKHQGKKFHGMFDRAVGTWGDVVGLSLLDWNGGTLISGHFYSSLLLGISALVALAGTYAQYYVDSRELNKANSGFVNGKLSASGAIHLGYVFAQLFFVALVIMDITHGFKSVAIGLLGCLIYVSAAVKDKRSGHYEIVDSWVNKR